VKEDHLKKEITLNGIDRSSLPSTSYGVKLANKLLDIGQSRIQAIANKTDSRSGAKTKEYGRSKDYNKKSKECRRW
ncbi:hypothetical protein PIB30_106369, partial [Stylosanthes scabra]|nr:hypothetical protein [Stylosanthes scabra]